MNVIVTDIWLCEDCMVAAVNDDYTGLDYHYSPLIAHEIMGEIKAGLNELGPNLVPDFDENDGELEFSNKTCECCGTHLAGKRFRFAQLGD